MKAMIVIVTAVVGCTDNGPSADPYQCMSAGGSACFQLPNAKVEAADATGASVAVDLTCNPTSMPLGPVTVTGTTVGLFGGNPIGPARVEMYGNLALTTALADVTSDDGSVDPMLLGSYSAAVDNLPSQIFVRASRVGLLPVTALYQHIDATQAQSYKVLLAGQDNFTTQLEAVGDKFQPGKSQVFGTAFDCNGNRMVNVIANVATTSAIASTRQYESGVRVYYDVDGTYPSLARRTQLSQTTTFGGFAISNLSFGHHFVQIWGFASDADISKQASGLSLLGEREVIVTNTETAYLVRVDGYVQ